MSSHMLADHGKSKPSRTRPTQLSNLPKSTATIESAGPSPDFPGAFPKENPTLSAFRATTSSPVTANGRRSTLSNRERSESSTGSFYSALDHQSFSIPDEIGSNARTLSSFKSQAENESKRGRDGPEEEPLTMSKKQKIEDDERDGDSEQRQKTLDPQTLQKLLAAKESEVAMLKKRVADINAQCSVARNDNQTLRDTIGKLEIKFEASEESYKKVISHILEHMDKRSTDGSLRIEDTKIDVNEDVAINSLKQKELVRGGHAAKDAKETKKSTPTPQSLIGRVTGFERNENVSDDEVKSEKFSKTQVIAPQHLKLAPTTLKPKLPETLTTEETIGDARKIREAASRMITDGSSSTNFTITETKTIPATSTEMKKTRDMRRMTRFDQRKEWISNMVKAHEEVSDDPKEHGKFFKALDSVLDELGPDGMSSDESTYDGEEEALLVHEMPHRCSVDSYMESIDAERRRAGLCQEPKRQRDLKPKIMTGRPPYQERPRNLYETQWAQEKGPIGMANLKAKDPSNAWNFIVETYRSDDDDDDDDNGNDD